MTRYNRTKTATVTPGTWPGRSPTDGPGYGTSPGWHRGTELEVGQARDRGRAWTRWVAPAGDK